MGYVFVKEGVWCVLPAPGDKCIGKAPHRKDYPKDVEIVRGDWTAKGKCFEVAIFVEYLGIGMEMTWRHLTYYSVKIAMKKYEANHILWALHLSHQALWPAKVKHT